MTDNARNSVRSHSRYACLFYFHAFACVNIIAGCLDLNKESTSVMGVCGLLFGRSGGR